MTENFLIIPLLILIGLAIAILIYLLPTIIAYNRKHKHTGFIFWINLLLGWSVLGWLTALLWALNSDINQDHKPPIQERIIASQKED